MPAGSAWKKTIAVFKAKAKLSPLPIVPKIVAKSIVPKIVAKSAGGVFATLPGAAFTTSEGIGHKLVEQAGTLSALFPLTFPTPQGIPSQATTSLSALSVAPSVAPAGAPAGAQPLALLGLIGAGLLLVFLVRSR